MQRQIEHRGRNPRGIPRAKDPARYPLVCRLVVLTDNCGSIFYGRTTHNRAVYTCGRYMRTAGAECASNQIDAEALLRFPMKTFRQFVDLHGRPDKLRQKLVERPRREAQQPAVDPRAAELSRLQSRQTELQAQVSTIEYRMAREKDDSLYAALAWQYQVAQAEAALALLDDVVRIMADPVARAESNPLIKRLGWWIGLRFQPAVRGTKRVIQRLVSGRIVCGDNPLPIPLFGKDNVDDGPLGWRVGRGSG